MKLLPNLVLLSYTYVDFNVFDDLTVLKLNLRIIVCYSQES